MVYVTSDGHVQQYRPWSLSRVFDAFWGTINFVTFFFRSMFHMDDPTTRGQYGQARRGPNAPRRGMGGIGRVSGISAPPACAPGG